MELTSGILRLVKGGQLSNEVADNVLARFRQDTQEFIQVWPLDSAIVGAAVGVVQRHRLRSGDAIHLATASSIFAIAGEAQKILVSSDAELLDAAKASGINVLEPQTDGSQSD